MRQTVLGLVAANTATLAIFLPGHGVARTGTAAASRTRFVRTSTQHRRSRRSNLLVPMARAAVGRTVHQSDARVGSHCLGG